MALTEGQWLYILVMELDERRRVERKESGVIEAAEHWEEVDDVQD